MRYIRVRSGLGVDYMVSQGVLMNDPDWPQEDLVEWLKSALVGSPESIFLLQAYDGEEIKGFVVALAPDKREHTFVLQAWMKAEDPQAKLIADMCFYKLCLWTDSLGRRFVRAETNRSVEAFYRKWNFVEKSRIIEFELPENIEERLISGQHGTLVGKAPEEVKEPDNPPEGLSKPPVEEGV